MTSHEVDDHLLYELTPTALDLINTGFYFFLLLFCVVIGLLVSIFVKSFFK